LFAPFFDFLMFGTGPILLAVFLMSALLIYRHSGNIAKLIAGKESRIGEKKTAAGVKPAPAKSAKK
jgi:glycerol-3-phosphate acyltransferase PlsY